MRIGQWDEMVQSLMREKRIHPAKVRFGRNGLALLESYHDESFHMDWRQDVYDKILMLIGGEGTLYLEKKQVTIRAPVVVVIPANTRHRIEDLRGLPISLYGICIHRKTGPVRHLARAACRHVRLLMDPHLIQRLYFWLQEWLLEQRQQEPGFLDLQVSLVTRILVELIRFPGAQDEPSLDSRQRIRAYVHRQEHEFWKPDSLDEVARQLGLSRRRFTQLFAELTGESWLARRTRLRMAHAATLLRDTSLPVRSVAFECGYGDITHFYRAFKRVHGMSPGSSRPEVCSPRIRREWTLRDSK